MANYWHFIDVKALLDEITAGITTSGSVGSYPVPFRIPVLRPPDLIGTPVDDKKKRYAGKQRFELP